MTLCHILPEREEGLVKKEDVPWCNGYRRW